MAKAVARDGPARDRSTREHILALAVDLASAEGLEGLTIGRLAAGLKMSKSALFGHFGSKQDLQLATLDAARAIFMKHVVEPALAADRGVPRLRALLEAWLSYVERSVFRGGCFFAAAAAEFDDRPGPVRDQVAALSKAWMDALTAEMREAQSRFELRATVDAAQLAFECHALVQEANWAFQLFGQKRAFSWARQAIHVCLERAATPEGLKVLRTSAGPRTRNKS